MSFREKVDAAVASATPLVLPGAYDVLSARIIEQLGFGGVYVTGAGFANSRLGVPDLGLTSLSQLCEHVACLAEVVEVPLVVDGDTGFGNAVGVTRTVRLLERAGASAIQLEDQEFPKRCGHFAGTTVIPVAEMVGKLRAACDSRRSDDLLIIGRTDAIATEGLESALERALQYKEAGADLIFVEGPRDVVELSAIGARTPGPLLANMVEGGVTPQLDRDELGQLGFHVILYANAALRGALAGVTRVLRELLESGTTAGVLGEMATFQQRQDAVGKPYFDELERRYAPEV